MRQQYANEHKNAQDGSLKNVSLKNKLVDSNVDYSEIPW